MRKYAAVDWHGGEYLPYVQWLPVAIVELITARSEDVSPEQKQLSTMAGQVNSNGRPRLDERTGFYETGGFFCDSLFSFRQVIRRQFSSHIAA